MKINCSSVTGRRSPLFVGVAVVLGMLAGLPEMGLAWGAPPPAAPPDKTPPPVVAPTPPLSPAPAPAIPPAATPAKPPAPAAETKPAAPETANSYYYEILNPGDLIRVRMEEDATVGFEGLVSASGTIPIPYIGEVYVAGKSPEDAAKSVSAALAKDIYQKASISITLVTKAPGKVYVYGAVRKPGVVSMPPIGNLTVMQLLSYVDGLTSWASAEDAYILRRTKPSVPPEKIKVNLTQIMANYVPMSDTDIVLQPDDVFCVPGMNGGLSFSVDTCEVIAVGEVNAPGIVYFSPGEQRTLMRAIFKSGGFNKFAKSKAVRLIRYGKNKERSEQTINASRIIDEGFLDEDVELKPGDMLIVPQKIINF